MAAPKEKNEGKDKRIENNEPPTSAIPGAHPLESLFAIEGAIAPV